MTLRTLLIAIMISVMPVRATPEPPEQDTTAERVSTVAPVQSSNEKPAISGSDDEQGLVVWAIDRYGDAGLDMPSIVVNFHGGRRACSGHTGMVGHSASGSTIDLCTAGLSEPEIQTVVVHELAHTWIFHNIDDSQRETFIRLHEIDAWHSPSLKWFEQGTEWAAETLAEILFPDVDRIIPDVETIPERLNAGYRILTGVNRSEM